MGLFDKIFGKAPKKAQTDSNDLFRMLTAYTPSFKTWDGKVYENALVRASIDTRARYVSKLRVRMEGGEKKLAARLKIAPNEFTTWSQFLYRLSTILDIRCTVFICPIYGDNFEKVGITLILPSSYDVLDVNGEPWLRFRFQDGSHASLPLVDVGIMTKYQYDSDFFGGDNDALNMTLSLIDLQAQAVDEAVKNSASYRFTATLSNFLNPDDLTKERERFNKYAFASNNGGGMLLFPNTYKEVQQIKPTNFTPDYNEMTLIQTNVFTYFGTNTAILQNKASPEDTDAFFSGCVEPIAIQLSEVLTRMLLNKNAVAYGSGVFVDSNRLKYMTTSQKIQLIKCVGDRGVMYIDEIRDLFNYPPLPDGAGQVAPIRGEFKDAADIKAENPEEDEEPQEKKEEKPQEGDTP